MADKHWGKLTMLLGIILVIDSFVVIQAMLSGTAVNGGFNIVELLIGIVIVGMGYKMHEMKM